MMLSMRPFQPARPPSKIEEAKGGEEMDDAFAEKVGEEAGPGGEEHQSVGAHASASSAEDFATVAKDIEGDEEGEAETEHAEELTDDAFGEGEASEEGDKSCAAGGDPGAGGYAAEGLDDRVRIWNVDGHWAGA